jgi:hypothetical protein
MIAIEQSRVSFFVPMTGRCECFPLIIVLELIVLRFLLIQVDWCGRG